MIVVLLLFAFLPCLMGNDVITLNVGVLPPWTQYFNEAIAKKSSNFDIFITELTVDNNKSDFDKLIEVNRKVQESQIHVIIGPFDASIAMVTDKQNIPYISMTAADKNTSSVFQLVPPLSGFTESILDLVLYNEWKRISIFYDDDDGSMLVEKFVSNQNLEFVKSWRLKKTAPLSNIRKDLLKMRTTLLQTSIISCNKENTKQILEQARNLAMLTTPYVWLIYDQGYGLSSVFDEFPDIVVNFTTFGLLPHKINEPHMDDDGYKLDKALAFDSLTLLNNSIGNIQEKTNEGIRRGIFNALQQVGLNGMTGNIQFGPYGHRYNYSISLTEVSDSLTYQDIGKWYSHPALYTSQLEFNNRLRNNKTLQFPLKGRKIKIVTILEKPFTMLKRDHEHYAGNNKFHGYAVDLVKEIAKKLEFEYELYLVHDGKFGSQLPNGEWNGMIGEVLAGNATMTMAPLSISAKREEAVDFTMPFMNRYINVIMKAPDLEKSFFDFLNPLHPVVWICTFGAFFIVSIILYILERFSTRVKTGRSRVYIKECFWFMFGSLLHSGTDTTPTTLPGRTLTSFWFFFSLILVSSYTANLAAFLTVKKINSPINSVADLALQNKIKYGTVSSSGVLSFFKTTTIQHFAKMGAQMAEIDPSSLVENTTEGFERVKRGNYAFFWDSTVNKYMTIENCGLMEIGPPFAPKGFGIAVPSGAVYRKELSMTLLRLGDFGILNQLQDKWWGRSTCPDVSKPSADETSELQLENVAGIFFILGSGIALAILVCAVEYVIRLLCGQEKKKNQDIDVRNSM